MEIDNDGRVQLFRFFGGDYANENNTTRSLMIALTRSPWSPIILRGFFDVVLGKLRSMPSEELPNIPCETLVAVREILGAWPASLRVRMQQGAASPDFIPQDTALDTALLLEIAPESEEEAAEADDKQRPAGRPVKPGGITDACLIATSRGGKTMAIVIESKLYGRAGADQMGQYEAAIRQRCQHDNAPIRMELTWEEIYSLLEHLPEEASFDPILRDFRDYLNERPGLVGFTRFRPEDFADPGRLDTQLYRLNQKIAREEAGNYKFKGDVVRVQGGCDYNLYVDAPDMQGNLGIIASVEPASVLCKLAVGWSDYRETTRALERSDDAAVLECIRALGEAGTLTIDLYFCCQIQANKVPAFAYRHFPGTADMAVDRWKDACSLAKAYNRRAHATDKVLEEILGRDGVEECQPGLGSLRGKEEGKRRLVKACFAILVTRHERELVRLDAAQQFEKFQGDLNLLAGLLTRLSSGPA